MVSLGVFVAVTFALFILFVFLPRFLQQDSAKIHRRIVLEFGTERPGGAANALYKDLDSLSLVDATEDEALSAGRIGNPSHDGLWKRLQDFLQPAQISLTVSHFLALTLAVGLALGAIGTLFGGWLAGLPAWGAGTLAPFLFLYVKRQARQEKFLKQLPNAFELMARVLRAGQSVPQALQAVAEAFEEPLAGEFASCQHKQNLGLRPEVAFREMAQRTRIMELRIFVMAMTIQRQTGGNLSEVLDRLAALVRARLRLRQQISTFTAEGRLQGLTLVILPVVVFVAMLFLNRQYAQVLLDHGMLLLATVACMAVGLLWIRRIVRFDG